MLLKSFLALSFSFPLWNRLCFVNTSYVFKIFIRCLMVRRTPPRKIPPRKISPCQTPPWWIPPRNIPPRKTTPRKAPLYLLMHFYTSFIKNEAWTCHRKKFSLVCFLKRFLLRCAWWICSNCESVGSLVNIG